MKCEEVRLELELLLRGELSRTQQNEVNSHLQRCPGCARDYQELKAKLSLLGQAQPCSAPPPPSDMEERIRLNFARRYHRKAVRFKIALALALLLAFLGTVYAQDFLTEFFGFDSGVKHAILQGAGQVVNQQKTVDGITVNLHSMVSDPNRSVVLYSIEGAPAQADSVHMRSTILPHTGSWSNTYAFNSGIVSGQLETGGKGFQSRMEVEFSDIYFTRTHTVDIPLAMEGNFPKIISLPGGAGQFIIEAVELTDERMRITLSSDLKEPYIAPGDLDGVLIANLYKNGEPLGAGYQVGQTYSQWPREILGDLAGKFTLSLSYFETVTKIPDPVVFAVRVDTEQAERHTVTTQLNKTIQLGPDVNLKILSLTASASQTALEFILTAPEGMGSYPDISLRAGSKAPESLTMDSEYRGETPVYVFRFDPTVPLDQLELQVHGYELWHVYDQKEYHKCNLTIPIP